jgi:hypothetical protein
MQHVNGICDSIGHQPGKGRQLLLDFAIANLANRGNLARTICRFGRESLCKFGLSTKQQCFHSMFTIVSRSRTLRFDFRRFGRSKLPTKVSVAPSVPSKLPVNLVNQGIICGVTVAGLPSWCTDAHSVICNSTIIDCSASTIVIAPSGQPSATTSSSLHAVSRQRNLQLCWYHLHHLQVAFRQRKL